MPARKIGFSIWKRSQMGVRRVIGGSSRFGSRRSGRVAGGPASARRLAYRSPLMAERHLVVVPHTHWDREWYATHEEFRYRLVRLVDRLLPILEGDPSFRHF